MPINSPATRIWIAQIAGRGGSETIELSDKEAELFNADPDAFAANREGLSVEEYADWIEVGCVALCAGQTKTGKPCAVQVAGMSDARSWKAKHRVLFCSAHDPERMAS